MIRRKARWLLVFAVALMLAETGCVTSASNLSNYKKEGVQYGTTKGSFRGRWWNYYERGRSYQDGAFYQEAESDFRTALASYAQDELWARTYGLHFIPEFFPHRELGVTLYYEKRFPESIAELELSLLQQHSARAAYFLDEARKELIQSAGQDAPAPAIDIRTPTAGIRLASLHADVTGEVNGANYIAALRINGRKYPLAVSKEHVEFAYPIQLKPGPNEIVIEADDLAAKHSKETLQIFVDVDGPVVSFDPAGPISGQLRGVAFDAAGVESLRMGDRQADVQRAQDGRVTFSFVAPESPADRALTYECRDTLGNATRGSVPYPVRVSSMIGSTQSSFYSAGTGLSLPVAILAGQVFGAADPAASAGVPLIEFENLRGDQEFLMNEILVSLRIESTSPVLNAELNHFPLDVIPGRTVQYVCRRVQLQPGANELSASARDGNQRLGTATVSITRREAEIERSNSRLNLAPIGIVWDGNAPKLDDEANYIYNDLLDQLQSFSRFQLLDRSLLSDVLTEQQLSSALGSGKQRLTLGKVVPAEVLMIGRARRDSTSVEIVMEAFSTETALSIARADVAGRADSVDQLKELIKDLALRVVQEFPKVNGTVAQVRGTLRGASPGIGRPVLAISNKLFAPSDEVTPENAAVVCDELQRRFVEADRFGFVDRNVLDDILTEQSVSDTLRAPGQSLAAGKLIGANAYVSGTVSKSGSAARVSVELVDCATTTSLARAEASGEVANDGDWRRLGAEVARQLLAASPEITPTVAPPDAPGAFVATLNRQNRIRESMKYVVYRDGEEIVDPVTKEVVGRETQIVGEGLVRSVGKASSVADVKTGPNASVPHVRVGDYVSTK